MFFGEFLPVVFWATNIFFRLIHISAKLSCGNINFLFSWMFRFLWNVITKKKKDRRICAVYSTCLYTKLSSNNTLIWTHLKITLRNIHIRNSSILFCGFQLWAFFVTIKTSIWKNEFSFSINVESLWNLWAK